MVGNLENSRSKRNKKKEDAALKKYFERNLDPENEEKELVGDF